MIGDFCIVRCRDGGVHMGYVREIAGRAVRVRVRGRVRGRVTQFTGRINRPHRSSPWNTTKTNHRATRCQCC